MKKNNNFGKIILMLALAIFVVSTFVLGGDSINRTSELINPTNSSQKEQPIDYNQFLQQLNKGEYNQVDVIPNQTGVYTIKTVKPTGEKNVLLAPYGEETNRQINNALNEMRNSTNVELKTKAEQISVNYAELKRSFFDFNNILSILGILIPIGIVWVIFSQTKNMSGRLGPAKVKIKTEIPTTRFSDVAGYKEEKKEFEEIIDFLKNQKKYIALGARIPHGVLLEGPPGTGKTLLAKAAAGEANINFMAIAGSEFIELYAGLGAARVRELFEDARKNAPTIVFIDEIDAIGRQRGAGFGGGNDEREQTLNQILVEMDGIQTRDSVLIFAATNRADVLDPALVRPGRFDRKMIINLPDKESRKAILEVHAKNKPIDSTVNFEQIAQNTQGMSGAELANVLNEAAILAVREDKKILTNELLEEAIDRVMMGPAKSNRIYTPKEKQMIAYHEAGHALIGVLDSQASIVQKVTIIPRGMAGGYAMMSPKEEKFTATKSELFSRIVGFLGGRAAEEIVFNEITTGASNDFQNATRIARSMVTEYGMSELGPIQYEENQGSVFLGRDYNKQQNYSHQIAEKIDNEIKKIIDTCYERAINILSNNRDKLDLLAKTLYERETLVAEEITNIVNNQSDKQED